MSNPPTPSTFDVIRDVRSLYVVPDGVLNPGVVSDGYRQALKRKADSITRSQYEVYSFSTKHNLSEAAVNELLEMLSNVSSCLIQTINNYDLCDAAVQVRFCPSDITYKTMKSMDNAARLAMMPDYEMYCVDLTEGVHIQ